MGHLHEILDEPGVARRRAHAQDSAQHAAL